MSILKEKTTSKRSYAKITLKKRQNMVKAIIQNGLTVSKAAKKFRIKLTTVRLILRKYQETGTFPMKNFKNCPKMMQDLAEKAETIQKYEINDDPQKDESIQDNKINEKQQSQQMCVDGCWFPQQCFYYYWPIVCWQ